MARNTALFLVLSVFWGTAFMVIKVGLEFMPPVLFAAFRYDVAGALMLGYLFLRRDYRRPRTRADWITVLGGAFLLIALYNAFLFLDEQGVKSGTAAILIAMSPILTAVFSRLLLPSEGLDILGVAGLVLGILGVGLVARPSSSGVSGIIYPGFVLIAAGSAALASVIIKRVEADIPSVGMAAWSNALGAVVLHIISLSMFSEGLTHVEITPVSVASVVYLGVFASSLSYLIYFVLLDRLGPVEINLISYAVPMIAALSGWVVLGEKLPPISFVGLIVILSGFALLKRAAIREKLNHYY